MERIYSDIVTAGHVGGFIVVPEFKLSYEVDEETLAKKADIAWLWTRDGPPGDTLPPYRVVAVFEVEGFNVPLETIDHHLNVYPRVRTLLASEFHCYVPLYSLATHRPQYGHDLKLVTRRVLERQNRAMNHNVVEVLDGAQPRDWLDRASRIATELAQL